MTESTRRRGRRGEGTTYRTTDGRWRAAIVAPDPATGLPRRRYLSAPTERELLAKLAAARTDRDRGEAVGATPTLEAWSRRWLIAARLRVRPATLANYRHGLDRLAPRLGSTELARLRVADVEDALAALVAGGLAPSTASLARTALGACLADAVRDGLIARNVARLARPPRIPVRERLALAPADLRRLFAAVEPDPLGPAIVLLGTLGLRRGELLGLRWDDVDRDGRTVAVRRQVARSADGFGYVEPKGSRSYRTVALPARAVAALDELAGDTTWPGAGPIVATGGDAPRPWHPVAFGSAFKATATRAGFPELRMHDLRHAAVSVALAAGVPPRDVAEAAGHSPTVLMRTYAHAMPGSRQRVAAAIDNALG
jgi:integrase